MSRLLIKPSAPDAQGRVIHVTPENAGWTYVGFDLHRLEPGQSVSSETGAREVCLGGFDPSLCGRIIDILLRNRLLIGFSEISKPLLDHRRKLYFGKLLIELRLCALKLSVHLGDHDSRELVPGFDLASYVDRHGLQISGDPGVQQSVFPRL